MFYSGTYSNMFDKKAETSLTTTGSGDQWIKIDLGKRIYLHYVKLENKNGYTFENTDVRYDNII